ncbi:MAG TPA: S8 family serine peptidase [Actinocatenispora sp.]
MRALRALLLVLVAVATVVVPGATAHAAPGSCATPSGVYTDGTPWAQDLLAPQRIWPLTTGRGQRVAVLGTGVDAGNAQLAGRVSAGGSFGGLGSARQDCDGRGTIAAGIVAAKPLGSTTFVGLAPGATIIPMRYTQTPGEPDPDRLAAAIDAAVHADATVVCVAVPSPTNSTRLAAAVRSALAHDVVVVSPALVARNGETAGPAYPTALPGVLGVAVTDRTGAPVSGGDRLDVAAPGADIVATSAGTDGHAGHRWPVTDPAAAAGYAAGGAALLRAYRSDLSAKQTVQRLEATAERATLPRDQRLGYGLIDPYAAVTAEPPGRATTHAAGPRTVAAAAPTPAEVDPRRAYVVVVGLGAVLAAIVATLLVAAVRRARANGWRPTR